MSYFAAQYWFECLYQELPPHVLESKFTCTWYAVYDVLMQKLSDRHTVCPNNPGVNLPAFWVSYDPQPPGNGMSN